MIAVGSEDSDLVYQDFQSGQLGVLHRSGETVFTAGFTLLSTTPVRSTFRFIEDSTKRVTDLAIEQKEQPTRPAIKLKFPQREFKARNEAGTLAGTIISATSRERHPGIVIIPGGGPKKRDTLQSWWWVYNGFTVLTYDKRGTGMSTGDYKQARITDLAADALAAVTLLKGEPSVDKDQVGIVGISEAGLTAPVVAANSSAVEFVVVSSAPGYSMPQQVVHEVAATSQCEGFSDEDVTRAKALRISLNEAVLKNGPWIQLARDIQSAETEKWFRGARVAPGWKSPFAAMIETNRRYLDFDPAKYWRQVKVPVLVVYGELDTQVDVKESQRIISRAHTKAQNRDHTVVVFPKANHILLEADRGCPDEYPRLSRIVPGYFNTLITWVLRRVR